MTRDIHADTITAAQAAAGEIFHLFELRFSAATLYLTDAPNDVVFSGNTYTAIAGLSHEAVQETTELGAQAVRITITGVDTALITRVLQQNYVGQTAIIRHAHIASDGTITSNPVVVFNGLMNAAFEVRESFTRSGGISTVATRLVSPFAIFNKLNGVRSNVSSHQKYYTSDTFWRHLANASDTGVMWGNTTPVFLHGSGGSGGGGGSQERGASTLF